MPIMGFGLISTQWTINNELTYDQIADFVKILNRAKDEYEFASNKRFWRTIHLNIALEGSYIATYDIAKSGLPFVQYKTILEALIQKANDILIYDNKYKRKYKNFMFDVTGTWEDGRIIMLSK